MNTKIDHLIIKCTITTYDSTIITKVNVCLINEIHMINENRHINCTDEQVKYGRR